MIKISIIVPAFNVEKYILKCLESLSNQTYSNIEIIIINDGSTDNSGVICKTYSAGNDKFSLFHQKNSGVSVARNLGIEKATGDYLLFVDPDDYIENDCCSKLAEVVNNIEYEVVFFMHKRLDEMTGTIKENDLGKSKKLSRDDIIQIQ